MAFVRSDPRCGWPPALFRPRAWSPKASGPVRLLVSEGQPQHVVGKKGTFQTDDAQRNSQFLQQCVLVQRLDLGPGKPFQHRREDRCARLADRAALPFEADVRDTLRTVEVQMKDHLVPAEWVRVPRVQGRARKGTLVPRMFVMIQDLLLIQVVGRGHQAKTSWTRLIPATSASTSSRSL